VAEHQPANKNRMTSGLSTFAARWRESIRSGFRTENFGALALELFALQFASNAPYRKICEARNATPLTVNHWAQIPAVPTAAFKELELSCLPVAERTAVFHSSGTTEQRPSRHFHNATSLAAYEASLWPWFAENFGFAMGDLRLLCLTPPPVQAPHSSLVHMFDVIRRQLAAEASAFVGRAEQGGVWDLSCDVAVEQLRRASECGQPLLLLGTAFSFVHLLDFLGEHDLRFQLPPGSRVLETGGYKGRSRTLPKAELHALITERLGVPTSRIVCEYGMSELSSQAYDQTPDASRAFHFPPWARVQIISPETGREVADGETGLLRVFDLANVFSVLAIQTEDLAVGRGDGFELIGRAALSEPRGCSLMAVEKT
jgi:hypothetical protein